MINVSTKHTIQHSGEQWVLIHHPGGRKYTKPTDGTKGSLVGVRTYYSRIGHALRAIANHSLRGAQSVEEMVAAMNKVNKQIKAVEKKIDAVVYGFEKETK
jgi:hypothetical protein